MLVLAMVLAKLPMYGWYLSGRILVYMQSVSAGPLEMLCTELALGPPCVHLNPEDLLMSFLLMWDLRKLNLWGNQCCVWVNTFRIWLNLNCVSFPYLVFCLHSCTESLCPLAKVSHKTGTSSLLLFWMSPAVILEMCLWELLSSWDSFMPS